MKFKTLVRAILCELLLSMWLLLMALARVIRLSSKLKKHCRSLIMPRATVAVDTERFDLKTLPEGFVVIRRMTFGEKLERTDQMMKIHGSTVDKDNPFEMSMSTKRIALKDFGALIVEHNLTDENDRALNFKDAKD